jgi:hypothetical protein
MNRTMEEQVDAALSALRGGNFEPNSSLEAEYRSVLRQLMEGKFAKDEWPEIVRPHWLCSHANTEPDNAGSRVWAYGDGCFAAGPVAATPRLAIKAWNAMVRDK